MHRERVKLAATGVSAPVSSSAAYSRLFASIRGLNPSARPPDNRPDYTRKCLIISMSALFTLSGLTGFAADALSPEAMAFFEKRVRPVLVERCYECHSVSAHKLRGGLLLDSRTGILKGGDSGPAVIAGNPDKSLLIKAIRYTDDDLQMPPKHRLDPQEIADLEKWVKMGAPDPRTETP